MALGPVSPSNDPALNFERINAAIREAGKVAGKADKGVVDGAVATAVAQSAAAISLPPPSTIRPGDGTRAFTFVQSLAALGGEAEALAPLDRSRVAFSAAGGVTRLLGQGILAAREADAIEPGRIVEVRAALRRRANSSDPNNDTVRVGALWLDQAKNVLPGTPCGVIADLAALTTSSGRRSVHAYIAAAAQDSVTLVAPPGAVYFRRFVYNFGHDGITDVEALASVDVTGLVIPPAVTTDFENRLAAQESQNLPSRVSEIEASLDQPNSLTFATLSDARAASIPTNVTSIRILGSSLPGDGIDGLFEAFATDPDPFIGLRDKFRSQNGRWFVRTDCQFLKRSAAAQDWFADDPNPVRIDRTVGRLFGGLAAETAYGASQGFELPNYRRLHSWLGGWMDEYGVNRAGPGYYLEEGAGLLWVSRNGAGAVTGASRQSDRYKVKPGYGVWKAGETIAVGDKRYWASKFYIATSAGTAGSAGPTHSSGIGSDGAVNWQYAGNAPGATIGGSFLAVADVNEPNGVAWAIYNEVQRDYDGGTAFAREVGVKNKGNNVHNNPYNKFPGGSTIGDWFAGGGDATTGPPLAPSTNAILIGRNGHTWNKGIVFTDDGISPVGQNGQVAIAFAKDHRLCWFTPESAFDGIGVVGAAIDCLVTQVGKRSALTFIDDGARITARGGLIAQFENGSGDTASNYLRFVSHAGAAPPEIRSDGPADSVDLQLSPKGPSGFVKIGTLSNDASSMSAFLAARHIRIRQGDGTVLYVPCTLNPW